jgi:hypothetical protein
MTEPPEPKFKIGDKVQTNEFFKKEYKGEPSFRGTVRSVNIATWFPNSEKEVKYLHVDVKTFRGNSISLNQDYLDLGDFSEEDEKKAHEQLARFKNIHERLDEIEKELFELNAEHQKLKEESNEAYLFLINNGYKIMTNGKEYFIEK